MGLVLMWRRKHSQLVCEGTSMTSPMREGIDTTNEANSCGEEDGRPMRSARLEA